MGFNKNLDVTQLAKTGSAMTLSFKGKNEAFPVYKVPLSMLYYNDQNGRIISWIAKHEEESGPISQITDIEEYNFKIASFIREAEGPNKYEKTKSNIKNIGQNKPGVVLKDGRIIDGNRRYTCLRDLYIESKNDLYAYFDAVVIDESWDNQTEEGKKALKRLENILQFGVEKEQEYNLVDRLLTIYKNCVSPKIFSDEEYTSQTNMGKKDFSNYKEAAIIMMDFLDFFNIHGKYYFIRQKNMGASFLELVKAKKVAGSPKEWDRIKQAFYMKLFRSKSRGNNGITRAIRKYIKDYTHSPQCVNDYLKSSYETMDKINDLVAQPFPVDPAKLQEKIDEDPNLGIELDRKDAELRENVNRQKTRQFPIEMGKKAFDNLNQIEQDLIKYMSDEERSTLKKYLIETKNIIDSIMIEIERNEKIS